MNGNFMSMSVSMEFLFNISCSFYIIRSDSLIILIILSKPARYFNRLLECIQYVSTAMMAHTTVLQAIVETMRPPMHPRTHAQ